MLLIFLMFLAVGASRALGLEPMYVSQFQYDEQLLEKMIRMEGEMGKWESRINEKLEQITRVQEQVNKLTESNTWETRINEALGNVTGVQEKVTHLSGSLSRIYSNLTDLQSRTDNRVQKFIESFKSETGATPNILFKARRVHNETPRKYEVIVFKDVLYNFGSGYDSSSGVFTAPVYGTYLFTARLLSKSDEAVLFEINVNGNMNSNGALFAHIGWSYATADSVVRLSPGQSVYVKSLYDDNVITNSGLHADLNSKSNEFTGVLLHM